MALLEISGLSVRFSSKKETVRAVESVDLSLEEGEACALVGESGCGKSVLGMSVMRILPANAVMKGRVRYRGTDLCDLDTREMLRIRGKEIAMVPQNSAMVLNPVMTVGRQVTESLLLHRGGSRQAAGETATGLLRRMGIQDPDQAMGRYPHEFSGGMRERILIAMSLACNPSLIIADEPTAGLDLLVRNQTLELLREESEGKTLLLITHDLGSAYCLCSRIMVMYAGEIVETGLTREVLSQPMHPYTLGLLASLPSAGLHPIPGLSPSPRDLPPGCRFGARCRSARDECHANHPELRTVTGSRQVRCLYYDRT